MIANEGSEVDGREGQGGDVETGFALDLVAILAGALDHDHAVEAGPWVSLSQPVDIVDDGDGAGLEKYHEVRVVRMNDRRHADPAITSWEGDEVGWWEGVTLVIETTNFSSASLARYQRLRISPDAKVVERFTRTSANELMYEFTVTDPSLYTQTWRAELPFKASTTRILEDACHEGNYSLPGVLAGAREEERNAVAKSDSH